MCHPLLKTQIHTDIPQCLGAPPATHRPRHTTTHTSVSLRTQKGAKHPIPTQTHTLLHTRNHTHEVYSPVGGTQAQEPLSSPRYHRAPAHMGDSLWGTRDQQRGSAGSEAWGSPKLTPPQLRPHLRHPRVTVKGLLGPLSLPWQKAGVQGGSVQAAAQAPGPHVPPRRTVLAGQSGLVLWVSAGPEGALGGWQRFAAGPCAYCLMA